MAQQGWYPDPAGGNGMRWFDGAQWTQHVQPAQMAPQMPVQQGVTAPQSQPAQAMQAVQPLRGTHQRKQYYADAEGFSFGTDGIRWSEAEWVCYFVQRDYVRLYGAGAPILPKNRIQGRGSKWLFSIGRNPYPSAPQVTLQESSMRTEVERMPIWDALVRLSQQYLEPRLVANYVNAVRAGQRVLLAKELYIDPVGFQASKISVPWNELGEIRHQKGAMFIYRRGVQQAQLKYPMATNNAVLVPAVFNALRQN